MKTGCNQTMEESTSMNSTQIHDAIFQILTQNKKFLKTTCYLSGGLILQSANLYLLVYRNV